MRLNKFSVTNYRSIASKSDISLQDFTVLVGKNNEGKSNLLKALNVAMNTLLLHGKGIRKNIILNRAYSTRKGHYDWERDFPFQYRNRKNGRSSIFTLEFQLNDEEIEEFHDELGLQINGILQIRITYGDDNRETIEVRKQRGTQFKKKSSEIASFISRRLRFNYISAVRTENMAIDVLRHLLNQKLLELTEDEEYLSALNKIEEIQSKILMDISSQLEPSLIKFLPNLNAVKIKSNLDRYNPSYWYHDIKLIIDDGVETDIVNKGDGIKSLVALAILKDLQAFKGASIVAIEEPESHLHSEAIRELVDVIHGLSNTSQVIITTHNPLFVQRNSVRANIIVDSGKARTAQRIEDIRRILGVLPEDNLQNTSNVLLVEGETDQIILKKIISSISPRIKNALTNNHLVIKRIGGVSNLGHTLTDLNQSMCKILIALDNDDAGKEAAKLAIEGKLVSAERIKYIGGPGGRESELEDIIKPCFYHDLLLNEFSLNTDNSAFRGNKKWSKRLKSLSMVEGTNLTSSMENNIKLKIAELIPDNISDFDDIFFVPKLNPIKSLISSIERMLEC
jgi:hypothetical protein